MYKSFRRLLTAFCVLLAAGDASALSITPATANAATGDQTSQSQINTAIAPIIGTATQLYKQNVGGSEVGSLAGSYNTTFENSPLDPMDALIEYVSGSYVGGTAWLLVKDGNQSPAWYLFNLTTLGWNGTDDLELRGFWPGNGAISHVTLYGTRVPETGVGVALLGLVLAGMGAVHRRSR
jgi:hypothetical protein